MAAIEKLYGTLEQYDELYNWAKEHNPEILIYFYERPDKPIELGFAMTLFPIKIDIWLLKNCPIEWVIRDILFQYGEENVHELILLLEEEDQ